VAFGDNETFNVLDVKATLNIDRYARIDVDATAAEYLYPDPALLVPEKNVDFLKRCVKSFHCVNFADNGSGLVYLRIERGQPVQMERAAFEKAIRSSDTLAAIRAVAPAALGGNVPAAPQAEYLNTKYGAALDSPGRPPTLGRWGPLP
jgi:hypothetical protein